MIQKSKELKQKTVTVESDSDEAEASDTEQQLHSNQDELIDVALATTAAATSNNPWMLPPVVKKSALYSKPQVRKKNKVTTKHKTTGENTDVHVAFCPFGEKEKKNNRKM